MNNGQCLFYNNYEPPENVRARLNTPEEDYKLKAPYRDLLGILEAEKCWSEEDAMHAQQILQELENWDHNERERRTTPPKDDRTIRDRLGKLYNKGLVLIIEGSGREKNYYWKIPDEKVPDPRLFKFTKVLRDISKPLEKILCRHDVVLIGVFIYILGTLLNPLHSFGFNLMMFGFSLFLIGHVMAHRDIPLFEYKRESYR